MKILAIHGAWSSSISFNYLKSKTVPKLWELVDYDHRIHSYEDIVHMSSGIMTEPYVAVGHSLGGLIALNQSQDPLCKGIVTLASPLAGLDLNLIQLYLSRSSLIGKIANGSREIDHLHRLSYEHVPVLHLIANKGYNPFIYENNDGVLPIKVQTGWSCGKMIEVSANHYEILQSDKTLFELMSFLSHLS